MPESIRPDLNRILGQIEGILSGGPGSLSIPSSDITRIASAAAPDVKTVELIDGGIALDYPVKVDTSELTGGMLGDIGDMLPTIESSVSVTVAPNVVDGKLVLDLGSLGALADRMGELDGLKKWVERLNQLVADAGQQFSAVEVTPEGVSVTTAAAG